MSIKQRFDDDLKAALLSGDRDVVEVLRGLKAAVLNEEVAKGLRDEGLSDESTEQLIAREIKKRNESATVYEGAGRSELADKERQEAAILEKYLPEQLSEQEIKEAIARIVDQTGAQGMSAMGQVIGAVKKQLGNGADGATVARLVKEALDK